jgi:hypothetical protein
MPFQSGRIFAETLLRMEQGEAPANFYIRFPPAGKVLMHPSAAIELTQMKRHRGGKGRSAEKDTLPQ